MVRNFVRVALARITSEGQITVPEQIRDELGVGAGDSLEFLSKVTEEQRHVRH